MRSTLTGVLLIFVGVGSSVVVVVYCITDIRVGMIVFVCVLSDDC